MKAFRIFLLILIIIGLALIFTQKIWVPKLVNQILSSEAPVKEAAKIPIYTPISITIQKIKEENFSGTRPVISGTSPVVIKTMEYVEMQVVAFGKQADADVPGMRVKFGTDSPPAIYSIDINSKYIKDSKTESIVTDVYSYTGGAHGGTVYNVITADQMSGKILSLSDIIKIDQQLVFTEFVKKELNDWRPEGNNQSVVFPDEIKNLKFNSFTNWSLSANNLIIYFDQYAIGPGALGAVAFTLPLTKIKDFLSPSFSL